MARVRKLVLAIAAASALTSGVAQALGLGEVTLKSALNQPLVAEIELVEVRDLTSNELIPNLASPEEFNKAGVDRQYFLTDLKFTPVLKPNGKSVIRVTSSKPVREPYLNFLVEVLWPSGRVLREYTLLLDPPLYSPQTAAAAAPKLPVAAPAPRPLAAPAPRPAAPVATAPVSRPAAPVAAPAPATAGKLEGDQYKTTASDTLWDIAQRERAGGSVHQAMLAIQDLNPNAFVDGNINRLKSGQVLRLPDEQQIKSRVQSEAIAQVAEQNAAWREGRSSAVAGARQLDATKRSAAGAAPAQAESKDSLKLVSAEAGKATAGSDKGASGDSKALNDKLAVTKESLDSTRRENDELKSRMGDLQSQLDKLQRLIQLKDSQLAKLQADLATQAEQPSTEAAVSAPATPVVAAPVQPAPVVESAAPAPTTPPAAAPDYNSSEEPAAKPEAAPEAVAQPPAEATAVQPVAPAAEAPAQAVESAPTPAPVAEEKPSTSFVDTLMANPMLLGLAGGGALLALLVGLMVLSRRNALKEAELQNSQAATDEESPFDTDQELPGSSFAGLDSDEAIVEAVAPAQDDRVTAQTGDVLGEADIYIAYGRFTQAAELLQDAINDEPQRSDLRLKLMEVQAELGDREGFARQESELREIGGATAEAEQLKSRYPGMAAFAAVGLAGAAAADDLGSFSLDDLTLDEPAAHAVDQDDTFDLSLDELEAELDRDLPASNRNDSLSDFAELSLDSDLDLTSPSPSAVSAADGLDFDLSLDSETAADSLALSDDLADFSLDLAEDSKSTISEENDFLLSLDDDLSAASTTNEFADLSLDLSEESLGADLELPADFDLSLAEEAPAAPAADSFAAQLDEVTAELDQLSESLDQPAGFVEFLAPAASAPQSANLDADDDFDFLSGTDETATKLDLARAYIDMGDTEGARDILDEVITEGSNGQQQEARELIARLV
ncbi:peptigoglycan-binding protein LysM [Pseudomonas cavernicola]|uniref:Peptigoglycan-binding protein LysM n=1 Tax=Pseudomonas cavernicola TaxID=2320866 RepID=A0A418XMW0_9PSED|nr:FimV/HubP family polar landmark protein [Pseudomonas cavernicola]RJG13795.1 peptigoglycan-binding protein LysM [Pseudomonas cavernicola]